MPNQRRYISMVGSKLRLLCSLVPCKLSFKCPAGNSLPKRTGRVPSGSALYRRARATIMSPNPTIGNFKGFWEAAWALKIPRPCLLCSRIWGPWGLTAWRILEKRRAAKRDRYSVSDFPFRCGCQDCLRHWLRELAALRRRYARTSTALRELLLS